MTQSGHLFSARTRRYSIGGRSEQTSGSVSVDQRPLWVEFANALYSIRTGRDGFEHPTPGLVSQRTFANNADKEPQAPCREDRWASSLARPSFDPSAYTWGIGGGDGTGGLRRARRITGAWVEPSRGVEAEHRPPCDADTIAGDRAQHQCASG